MSRYEMMIGLPFLPKGAIYQFDIETADVHRVVDGAPCEFPLRIGLASYLWLLMTERNPEILKKLRS